MLGRERAFGGVPDAGAITQVQVLEMAAAEAERRIADTQKCAPLLAPHYHLHAPALCRTQLFQMHAYAP